MTTYLELQKLKIAYNEKYKAWGKDLYEAALSLCDLLKKKLSAPEELLVMKLTGDELHWHPVMLEKPLNDINQHGKLGYVMLCRNDVEKFIKDGSLLFSISLNFPSIELDHNENSFFRHGYEVMSTYIILSVRFVNHQPVYGMRHCDTYELFGEEIFQEEMAEKLIQQYLESIEFDPYSGKKKPKFGFV